MCVCVCLNWASLRAGERTINLFLSLISMKCNNICDCRLLFNKFGFWCWSPKFCEHKRKPHLPFAKSKSSYYERTINSWWLAIFSNVGIDAWGIEFRNIHVISSHPFRRLKRLNSSIAFSSHLMEGGMLIYTLCWSSSFPNSDSIKMGKCAVILLCTA